MKARSRRPKSTGQVIAEFALVVPLFLLVVFGIAEGGYYVVATTIVNHATHEGARIGVLGSTSASDSIRERMKRDAGAVVGLANDDIAICVKDKGCADADYQSRKAGDRLHVTTTYTHRLLIDFVFGGLAFPANAEAELRVEGGPSA